MLTKIRNVTDQGTAEENVLYLVMDGDDIVAGVADEAVADGMIAVANRENPSSEMPELTSVNTTCRTE